MPFRHSPVRAAGPYEVVAARAGMGVQHEQRRRLALQRAQQPDQHRVLHAVGEIAGVEGVAVVHSGHPAASAARSRSPVVDQPQPQPLDPGPRHHHRVVGAQPHRRRHQLEALRARRPPPAPPGSRRSPPRRRRPPARAHPVHARASSPSRASPGPPAPRPPRAESSAAMSAATCAGSAPAPCRATSLRHRRLQPGEAEVAARPAPASAAGTR